VAGAAAGKSAVDEISRRRVLGAAACGDGQRPAPRRLVATAVTAAGHDDLVDVTTLLVSEVVTNSVLHAATEMQLRFRAAAAADGHSGGDASFGEA